MVGLMRGTSDKPEFSELIRIKSDLRQISDVFRS